MSEVIWGIIRFLYVDDWNKFLKPVKANSHAVCLLLVDLKIFYEESIFTFARFSILAFYIF